MGLLKFPPPPNTHLDHLHFLLRPPSSAHLSPFLPLFPAGGLSLARGGGEGGCLPAAAARPPMRRHCSSPLTVAPQSNLGDNCGVRAEMTCVAGVMYQPYSTAQPLPTSPYLPPTSTSSSSSTIPYLSPPPLLAPSTSSSPSHPHYQEQALPLKRELVDTVRLSRSCILVTNVCTLVQDLMEVGSPGKLLVINAFLLGNGTAFQRHYNLGLQKLINLLIQQ